MLFFGYNISRRDLYSIHENRKKHENKLIRILRDQQLMMKTKMRKG